MRGEDGMAEALSAQGRQDVGSGVVEPALVQAPIVFYVEVTRELVETMRLKIHTEVFVERFYGMAELLPVFLEAQRRIAELAHEAIGDLEAELGIVEKY
jgi:hypothetical protein